MVIVKTNLNYAATSNHRNRFYYFQKTSQKQKKIMINDMPKNEVMNYVTDYVIDYVFLQLESIIFCPFLHNFDDVVGLGVCSVFQNLNDIT